MVTDDEAISGPILVFMLRHGLEVSYNFSEGGEYLYWEPFKERVSIILL